MSVLAAKAMLLDGLALRAGEVIPPAHWAQQRERTRRCLIRTRLVRSSDLMPVVVADRPPVALTTPRIADGPRTRGRPRKER